MGTLTFVLAAAFIFFIGFVIYKKPGVLKKDETKPLSVSNFSLKKTFIGDWKKFGVWILLMFLVWSYVHDTRACRDMINNLDEICMNRSMQLMNQRTDSTTIDLNKLDTRGDDGDTREAGTSDKQGSPYLIP